MKKHLLLTSVAIGLAVGLASALSAVAATDGVYPAMIREDRVWEYLWIRVESKKTDKPTDCELFRGSTAPRKKTVRNTTGSSIAATG